jgi:S-(hydroxymethyl)glutathione dehydrogenase/alcohol dehydrogenase
MKTTAAVVSAAGSAWEIVELDLDGPGPGEVLVRFVAAGLCHSDEHLRDGTLPSRYPMVGGHEGAGVIEAVGAGVDRVAVGDHVVCSFLPSCGHCRYCSTGRQNLCDLGRYVADGCLPDETFRFHLDGADVGGYCMLGTFSERAVISQFSCVRVDADLPLTSAVLVGCGVPTGFGAASSSAEVHHGDTVVVYGVGGIGINAVQGARICGAANVVAVDPVAFKRETAAKLGATHQFATAEEAQEAVTSLTRGQGADVSIVTATTATTELISAAFDIVGKRGQTIIVSLAAPENNISLSSLMLTSYEKTLRGSLFGSCNPQFEIPRMLEMYRSGILELDSLITTRYRLDEVNQGYDDLLNGRNIRGIIVFD